MNEVIKITGAVVYPEITIDGDAIIFPKINKEYKYALIKDGILWASKNGKLFCMAISIETKDGEYAMINGKLEKRGEYGGNEQC